MTSYLFRRVGRAAATALLGGTLMLMPGAATAVAQPSATSASTCLADPKLGEREVAAELLGHTHDLAALPAGVVLIGDKGFAGREFERQMSAPGITFVRPDRRNEARRHGNLAAIRQRIESIINTAKSQLSLERHGARTPPA